MEFHAGEGPAILNPIRTENDVHVLGRDDLPPSYLATLEAIRLAKKELGRLPLIGFSGAPFTLGCYSVEGGGSKDFVLAKRLMMERPDLWHELMRKLSGLVATYLRAQAKAGADALQLFDTWAGLLSPADYGTFALPYVRQVVDAVKPTGLPLIYFSLGTGGMLELVGTCGADVIGLDWRVDLGASRRRLAGNARAAADAAADLAVQGNLDPVALLAEWPGLKARAGEVLTSAAGQPGHIFNLGHGVLQHTPADNVRRLVDFVHEWEIEPGTFVNGQ